ncbi:MAG: HEAT repeat domain-containing protein [Planctomycetota bacterium]|jgi:hypothetical protein
MLKGTRALLLLVLAGTCAGCSYMEARGRDFQDCFKLSAGAGLGVYGGVGVGPVKVEAGYWNGYSAGTNGDFGLYTGHEESFGVPFPTGFVVGPLAAIFVEKSDPFWPLIIVGLWVCTGCNSIEYHDAQNVELLKDCKSASGRLVYLWPMPAQSDQIERTWEQYFWLEAEAYCFVGFRVGFNIAEFADFILGWFGLDICDDDRDPKGRAIERVRKRLASNNTRVRRDTLQELRDWILRDKRTEFIEEITAMLDWRNGCVREDAAEFLSEFAGVSDRVVPVLVKALSDKSGSVREKAMASLGRIGAGAREAIPKLEALSAGGSVLDMQCAEAALAAIRKASGASPQEAREHLLRAREELRSEDPAVRRKGAAEIGKQGSQAKEFVPDLIRALSDGESGVRRAAIKALGRIGPEARGAVRDLVKLLHHEDHDVHMEAAYALSRMGREPSRALPGLIRALDLSCHRVLNYVAETLGNIGPEAKDALPRLGELAEKGTCSCVREAAGEAVRKIKGEKE